ncbi:hypothetical protein DFQ28_000913 [Apophysomyces sp. BC1034]|nr:hypothetical protein DFQ30_010288 [Apophysomyces sp. BC1015]KAG0180707.1 hypothetical protein DFQ29_000106 [Apophysomyces sp. BC1021]KAG0191114.1 hypothetical protein DFQ28_000913 [Apophysomyces sp. BC1034]
MPIPAGRKGASMLQKTNYTFELVCQTATDWHEWMPKFSTNSRRSAERDLALKLEEIGSYAIRKLKAQEAAKIRREMKRKKTKELEEMPRKRSRRLEEKHDGELERLKMEELQRQQEELKAIQRKHEQEQKRKLKEQEDQRLRLAEMKLKAHVHQMVDNLVTDVVRSGCVENSRRSRVTDDSRVVFLKELRGKLSKSASEKDRIRKMRGWASLISPLNAVHVTTGSRQAKSLIQKLMFQGDGCRKDDPLLQNTLRVFIATVQATKASKPFREPLDPTQNNMKQYQEVVAEPMDLQTIYKKLLLDGYCHLKHRCGFEQFLYDLDLIFTNCYLFYNEDSEEYEDAQAMELYVHDLFISVFGAVAV